MRIFIQFIIIFLISANIGFSQTGKITGKVYDGQTGNSLPAASVQLVQTGQQATTDVNGSFSFGKLKVGVYTVHVNFISYQLKTSEEITVIAGSVNNIDITLEKTSAKLGDVTVKGRKASKETATALLVLQKNRSSISDGISAEVIRSTPDRSASDVLKRIPGASIQDDKFAIIRGLNDRYNSAFINGSPAPSSESDRKAFAFDVFSANLLDNIVIAKTATPDVTGDFAGGIVSINTKSLPDQSFQSISVGGGYNTITSFKDRVTYTGGGWDMFNKQFTSALPEKENFPLNFKSQETLAKKANNNWKLSQNQFSPNANFQYTMGQNFQRNNKDFAGFLLSGTYSVTNSFFEINRKLYDYGTDPNDPAILNSDFNSKIYSSRVLAGILANFSIKIDQNNIINFKNMYNLNTDDRLINRAGEKDINPLANSSVLIDQHARVFYGSKFYSSQLEGQHYFPEDKIKSNWLLYNSEINRTNPSTNDTYVFSENTNSFIPQIGDGANDNDAGTIKSILTNENIKGFQFDVSTPIDISENFTNILKTGVNYISRSRDFKSRRIGFAPSNNFNYDIYNEPLETLFDTKNLGENGFRLVDRTAPFDKYDGNVQNLATYLMTDTRILKNIRLIGGIRAESFNMAVNSVKLDYVTPLAYRTYVSNLLPSVNFVFSVNDKQNIRLSYSKTVNRPEFREVAPFLFYDYSTGFTVSGNDTLKTAQITNYDFRYEIYPGRGQVISISAFHKKFINPIEQVYQLNAVNPNITYQNSPEATVTGIETEVRLVLGSLLNKRSTILNNLTFLANYSWLKSKTIIPYSADINVERTMQGQSPFLINTGFIYNDERKGWGGSVFLNNSGPRVYIGGNNFYLDVWESGRNVVDFQVSKSLLKRKMDIRLNVRDLLAQKLNYFEDRNVNKKFDEGTDVLIQSNTFGRVISLSFTYKL